MKIPNYVEIPTKFFSDSKDPRQESRSCKITFRKLMHTSVIQKALRSVAPAVKAVSRSIDNMGATLEVCRFGPLQLSTAGSNPLRLPHLQAVKIVEGTTAPTSSLPFDVSEERRTFFLPFASSLALLQQLDSCAGSADNKQGKTPFVGAAFVAPTATVLGDVTIGAGSSVWYGATIRGDVHNIKIGANSSIGEGSMVHVAKIAGKLPKSHGKTALKPTATRRN